MDYARLIEKAKALGCVPHERMPLSKLTTFKVGGETPLFLEVPPAAAAEAVALCHQEGVETLWIGRGSNLLIGDRGVTAVVLQLQADEPVFEGDRVTAPAGMSLIALCRAVRDRGLAGLEFAFGIPGTVGGGVYMNAGAYGGEMKDVVESARVLTADGRVESYSAEELALSYRHSVLMENGGTVLSVTLRLSVEDPAVIAARMEDFMARRRDKQPLEYPSAGSFFKRPEGHFAGALIEGCGLKGFRVGDAQVSEKHAGFVINRGRATCDEIRELAAQVRARVLAETGVELHPEVRLLGDRWPWEE